MKQKFVYKRSSHFKQTMENYQKEGRDNIDPVIIERVRKHLADFGAAGHQVSLPMVRDALRSLNLRQLYDAAPRIWSALGGSHLADLTVPVTLLNDESDPKQQNVAESKFEQVDCVICLELLDDGHKRCVVALDCGHSFHGQCIDEWVQRKNDSCPVCRDKILVGRGVLVALDKFVAARKGMTLSGLFSDIAKLFFNAAEEHAERKSRDDRNDSDGKQQQQRRTGFALSHQYLLVRIIHQLLHCPILSAECKTELRVARMFLSTPLSRMKLGKYIVNLFYCN